MVRAWRFVDVAGWRAVSNPRFPTPVQDFQRNIMFLPSQSWDIVLMLSDYKPASLFTFIKPAGLYVIWLPDVTIWCLVAALKGRFSIAGSLSDRQVAFPASYPLIFAASMWRRDSVLWGASVTERKPVRPHIRSYSPPACEGEVQYCGEPPWPRGSVLGFRPLIWVASLWRLYIWGLKSMPYFSQSGDDITCGVKTQLYNNNTEYSRRQTQKETNECSFCSKLLCPLFRYNETNFRCFTCFRLVFLPGRVCLNVRWADHPSVQPRADTMTGENIWH